MYVFSLMFTKTINMITLNVLKCVLIFMLCLFKKNLLFFYCVTNTYLNPFIQNINEILYKVVVFFKCFSGIMSYTNFYRNKTF